MRHEDALTYLEQCVASLDPRNKYHLRIKPTSDPFKVASEDSGGMTVERCWAEFHEAKKMIQEGSGRIVNDLVHMYAALTERPYVEYHSFQFYPYLIVLMKAKEDTYEARLKWSLSLLTEIRTTAFSHLVFFSGRGQTFTSSNVPSFPYDLYHTLCYYKYGKHPGGWRQAERFFLDIYADFLHKRPLR